MKLSSKFKKACKNQGFNAEKIMPNFSMYPERHRNALIALAQLFIISDDANGKFDPDWNDSNPKYRAWVDMEKTKDNPSGFRFGDAFYGSSGAGAFLGSRLSFRDAESTKKFFEENKALLKDAMTIPKAKK